MKNVEVVNRKFPAFRVPMVGIQLRGWAVRYKSGMESVGEIEPGYWLSEWHLSNDNHASLNFEPELHMVFDNEEYAKTVSTALRENAEIETEVVKI
jgi:hypothetical protein